MEIMRTDSESKTEVQGVVERYARRAPGSLYSILRPEVILSTQELQRTMLFMLGSACGYAADDLRTLKLVDVGCGYGGHLLDFLRFGFAPQNLRGIELLPDRAAAARAVLPEGIKVHGGDASEAGVAPASQDVVFQSVVFSSLLDDAFQEQLADRMWSWVRPGGGVLWYDFTMNNPRNPDVRGVPLKRVRALFPDGTIHSRRITLAPPIARRVAQLHPSLYTLFNGMPLLRTHVLCWIAKS